MDVRQQYKELTHTVIQDAWILRKTSPPASRQAHVIYKLSGSSHVFCVPPLCAWRQLSNNWTNSSACDHATASKDILALTSPSLLNRKQAHPMGGVPGSTTCHQRSVCIRHHKSDTSIGLSACAFMGACLASSLVSF